MPSFTDMKSFLSFIQQINFGKLLDSCKPDLSKLPSGSFVHDSELKWVPNKENDYLRVRNESTPVITNIFMEEINEKRLLKLGFHKGDFPEMFFTLNDETALVLAYAEGKWYGAIHQFQGLKPPFERVYIPKDLKTMSDVKLLIQALSEK